MCQIKSEFADANWIVEGDIKNCFGSINHAVLISLLEKKISCKRTLNLIQQHITVGYVEGKGVVAVEVGIPQGRILGPVLSNIYMTPFDNYMEGIMNKLGKPFRKHNRSYWNHLKKAEGLLSVGKKADALKYWNFHRRSNRAILRYAKGENHVRYVRYADDFVIAF